MAGPLSGVRIIELAGMGPGPFGCMILADHGAEVIRIDRPSAKFDDRDPMLRSRVNLALDLKKPDDVARLLDLVQTADALVEGYRPGTLERLGLAPDILLARNPRLVVARMTGWGQEGRQAQAAGHDINYIAVTGALHAIGGKDRPTPPLALVGDFGGGAMFLAFSILAGLTHARTTGVGQIIDCAMVDGVRLLMAPFVAFQNDGSWKDERQANIIDGGAHFYNTYGTADGKFVAVGAIEPQFYAQLLSGLGLSNDPDFADQMDKAKWPALSDRMAAKFREKTREAWCTIFDGTDACVAPVLSIEEAQTHPMAIERRSFIEVDGRIQPAPAPRYSATPLDLPTASRNIAGI
ncbi:CoA transferase [Sphingopyxis granuli]|uniref:CaiB/BaiF CoA transferase family protein n=1 Tax=Sphingopyxis granuli TaxID=267128 RepID=UPI001F53551C|nr:CaiB/BaiF CoA-transferase family protein [Sphingopyxis granuli]UNK81052.1 CoA transferase [Sphingopyxis granuli]